MQAARVSIVAMSDGSESKHSLGDVMSKIRELARKGKAHAKYGTMPDSDLQALVVANPKLAQLVSGSESSKSSRSAPAPAAEEEEQAEGDEDEEEEGENEGEEEEQAEEDAEEEDEHHGEEEEEEEEATEPPLKKPAALAALGVTSGSSTALYRRPASLPAPSPKRSLQSPPPADTPTDTPKKRKANLEIHAFSGRRPLRDIKQISANILVRNVFEIPKQYSRNILKMAGGHFSTEHVNILNSL